MVVPRAGTHFLLILTLSYTVLFHLYDLILAKSFHSAVGYLNFWFIVLEVKLSQELKFGKMRRPGELAP